MTITPEQLEAIGIKKRNGEIKDSWTSLAEKYSNGMFSDGEQFRMWIKNRLRSKNKGSGNPKTVATDFKESIEINKDGSQSSNKLVKMSIDDSKDANFLLKSHGYDPDSWELISARSNIWNSYSKKDGIMQLYASKISVKPKVIGFSFEKILDEIRNNTTHLLIDRKYENVQDKRLLEISFYDPHFGISNYEHYQQTQIDTLNAIESIRWEEILFVIGQDMFHNDNFRGQTASGTFIDRVDMAQAWKDAKKFYFPLIYAAIKNSNNVKIVFSKGNHDESMSWAFVQMLMEKFKDVEYDDSFIERKVHTFGDIFIGLTHGDKARKNLHSLFQVEYPMEWAISKTREIHIGHLHKEDSLDHFGMMIRTLSTRNKTDEWHKNNGYIGNHKRFMLFEYNEQELKRIHYV